MDTETLALKNKSVSKVGWVATHGLTSNMDVDELREKFKFLTLSYF